MAEEVETITACNGDLSLCDKRLNEVAYATTHNAHSTLPDDFLALTANQDLTATEQLNAGVRALNIKTYYNADCGTMGHNLYHGFAFLGCRLVNDFLTEVKTWLDANPNEVLIYTIEGSSPLAELQKSFTATGYDTLLYQHTTGEEWPTLRELIATGKRVVIFTSRSGNENATGYHSYWGNVFGNDYAAESRTDFSCDLDNRGNNASGDFFLMNHFITRLTPQQDSSAAINQFDYLNARASACRDQQQKIPNFVMIDFMGEGEVMRVVDALNGVQ